MTTLAAHVVTAVRQASRYRIIGGEVTICPCGVHVTARAAHTASLGALGRAAMATHFASGSCGLVAALANLGERHNG